MQFFDFGSTESFHFFQWVVNSGKVDSDRLVEKAFELVEGDEWFGMGCDASTVAKDKLSDLLQELLETEFEKSTGVDEQMIADFSDPSDYQHEGALTTPLLYEQILRIDADTVAEALLIRARKWSPDKEAPELI